MFEGGDADKLAIFEIETMTANKYPYFYYLLSSTANASAAWISAKRALPINEDFTIAC
jgi:hypothetical protein